MATTSTVPTVKTALVAALDARPGLSNVDVTYAWQPWQPNDQMFCGDVDAASDIPTIKAGRKQRQESYTVDFVIRTYDPHGTPATASVTEARAFTLLAELEDQLADDVQIDGVTAIQWARATTFTSTMQPVDKGWSCELLTGITVEARLT